MSSQIRWRHFALAAGTATVVGALLILSFAGTGSARPPGGNGGGNTPAYTIVAFMPPGSISTASYVSDINDNGQAVGKLEFASGVHEAIHLDIPSGLYTKLANGKFANGINNCNEIVGSDGVSGLYWSRPSDSPIVLPPLPGDTVSWAAEINDAGIIIGESAYVEGNDYLSLPVVWRVYVDDNQERQVDGPKALPPLDSLSHAAWDINEVVAGAALVAGESDGEAVIWTIELNGDGTLGEPKRPLGVGTLPEPNSNWSEARGINNSGDVCGQSGVLPFMAPPGQDPTSLPIPRGTLNGGALDMNDSDEVVGSVRLQLKGNYVGPGTEYAYLWKGGKSIDLSQAIAIDSGWQRLRTAWVINNSGAIGGSGIFDKEFRGYILIPNTP